MASCNAETALNEVNIEVDDSMGGTSLVKDASSEKDPCSELPFKNGFESGIMEAPCNVELKSSIMKKRTKKKRQKKLQNGNGEFQEDTSSIKSNSIERDCFLESTIDVSKENGGISLAKSVDNEEFCETADAELVDVDSGSQSSPNAMVDVNMGEVEIDQTRSLGKSKESRSMRLFKVCLADFVKEVLKPSWRQGNMSKETFKTIVKKTVDKVSESMKGHRIPKSKAKINDYIDSSQRKLTKLVMGYVDKYAKG